MKKGGHLQQNEKMNEWLNEELTPGTSSSPSCCSSCGCHRCRCAATDKHQSNWSDATVSVFTELRANLHGVITAHTRVQVRNKKTLNLVQGHEEVTAPPCFTARWCSFENNTGTRTPTVCLWTQHGRGHWRLDCCRWCFCLEEVKINRINRSGLVYCTKRNP